MPDAKTHMPTDSKPSELNALTQTCSACGCASPLTKLFRKTGRADVLCPRCYLQHAETQQRHATVIIALALGGLLVFTLFRVWLGLGPPFLLGNLALIPVALYVSIIGHELAHALAAWFTGARVYEFRIGAGPDLIKLRLGELWLRVRRYLAGGDCLASYPPGRQQRWRMVILYAAGMLFHLLLIGMLLPGFPHADPTRAWAWREALLIANVALLIGGLRTHQALTQDGPVMADAAQIKQLLTTPWDPAAQLAAAYTAQAALAWQREAFIQAEAAARAGLVVAPRHPLLLNLRGVAMLELGRAAEAQAVFEVLAAADMETETAQLIPDPDSQAMIQAMNRNNLAYALLLDQAAGPGLERARELAETAFAVVPWEASIEGTFGATLVETGAVEAGLRHLVAAGAQYDRPRSQAANLAWCALGQQRLGRVEQAQALLREAARLDGAGPAVQRITHRIAAAACDSGA